MNMDTPEDYIKKLKKKKQENVWENVKIDANY